MDERFGGSRVALRALSPDEAQAWLDGQRPYPAVADCPVAEALTAYRLLLDGLREGFRYEVFAVCRRSDGLALGDLAVWPRPDEPDTLGLGYALAVSARGAGYAAEAVTALTDSLLADTPATTFTAETDRTNLASQRVLLRAGFHLERQVGHRLWFARRGRAAHAA